MGAVVLALSIKADASHDEKADESTWTRFLIVQSACTTESAFSMKDGGCRGAFDSIRVRIQLGPNDDDHSTHELNFPP